MEWLTQNLTSSYPFSDGVVDPITAVFGDAFVMAPASGIFTLSIFHPGSLTNAHVQIKAGATIVLETTVATVTTFYTYTVLEGVDSARNSRYRFVLDTEALLQYDTLATPIAFTAFVCHETQNGISTINGLDGDITLAVDKYSDISIENNIVSFGFQNPADRVVCGDCDKVLSINGQDPDQFGSFNIAFGACYRAVYSEQSLNKLYFVNYCSACLDCDDVVTMDGVLHDQAEYFYKLASIYHDQFNRYQRVVGHANQEIEAAENRDNILISIPGSGVNNPGGIIDIRGRAFSRPYFSQLSVGLVNATPWDITIDVTVSISDTAVANQFTYIDKAALLQRFQNTGEQFTELDPLPGTASISMAAQEIAAFSTEVQRTNPSSGSSTEGDWVVDVTVTFVSGPTPLPDPVSASRSYLLEIVATA